MSFLLIPTTARCSARRYRAASMPFWPATWFITSAVGTTTPRADFDAVATRQSDLRKIYDGMSTVVSSSAGMSSYSAMRDSEGRGAYSFEVPCDARGVAITWAMDDEYANALRPTKSVLADDRGALSAKTATTNNLFNDEVFTCSWRSR